jgi:hypothetical protein
MDPRLPPQQIIWNLLTTAIKFTPKGGRIEVRLERIASHVEITVSDLIENRSSKGQRPTGFTFQRVMKRCFDLLPAFPLVHTDLLISRKSAVKSGLALSEMD